MKGYVGSLSTDRRVSECSFEQQHDTVELPYYRVQCLVFVNIIMSSGF